MKKHRPWRANTVNFNPAPQPAQIQSLDCAHKWRGHYGVSGPSVRGCYAARLKARTILTKLTTVTRMHSHAAIRQIGSLAESRGPGTPAR